jgi:Domain of unknown function (DUF1707)
VATPYTRATDSDRNNTCQVLDSALSEGQLSMEEHRQRISAATNATTLGELQSLVSDLQTHSAPVQLPTPKSPAGGWGIRIAVGVVLVLLGAGIAWGLFGNTSSPSQITSTPGATPSGSSAAVATPSTSPSQAPPQLLSIGGLTGFLAEMRKQFGDTLGYELTVWPDRAVLARPDSVNAHKTVSWYYSNGGWMSTGTVPIPIDTTVGDLSKFNVQEVVGVLHGAPQSLHVNNATNTYLIIDSAKDGSLTLQIHLSDNDSSSGYIELAADGFVEQIHPANS